MKTTLIALALFASTFSARAFDFADLANSTMSSASIQAMLKNALAAYFPLEDAINPVVRVGMGYGLKNANGKVALSCAEGSHSIMAVQMFSCRVSDLDQKVLRDLARVLSNSGEDITQGHNHGYLLRAQDQDLSCVFQGRSLLVTCSFSKGTKKLF